MKIRLDGQASVELGVAVAAALAALVADRLLPKTPWAGWLLSAVAVLVALAALTRVSLKAEGGPTRKQRRLIQKQREEADRRDRLIRGLSLKYVLEAISAGIEPESRTMAPEPWLNAQLEERNEQFRVRVKDGRWSECPN